MKQVTYVGVHRQMAFREEALGGLTTWHVLPVGRRLRAGGLRGHVELDRVERLEETDDHEGHRSDRIGSHVWFLRLSEQS